LGGNSGAMLIVILVGFAALLLFAGPILNTISEFTGGQPFEMPSLTNIINQIKNALGLGNGGSNATGSAGVAFTVYFTDGTTTDINPDLSFSIQSFSVSYAGNNKTISKIDVKVPAKLSDLSGVWSCQTEMRVELYKKPSTSPATSSTKQYTTGGASWPSGETKTMATFTLQSFELDNIFAQFGKGDYLLQVKAWITLTTTVNGVSQSYTSETLAGGLDIAGV
jgi:hypothetical protein